MSRLLNSIALAVIVFLLGLTPSAAFQELPDGLDMPYATNPLENLVNGGQPSKRDLEKFAEEGFALVINLRLDGEFDRFDEQQFVEDLGMGYINIPVRGMRDLSEANARALHEAIEGAEGPVLLHCTVGMRASGLLAVESYLFDGLSSDQAVDLATRAHMSHMDSTIEAAIRKIEKD